MSPQPRNRSRAPMRSVGAKATTPSSDSRARALRNSIAAGQVRKNADRSVDWDAVIERFKRDMRRRYRAERKERSVTVTKQATHPEVSTKGGSSAPDATPGQETASTSECGDDQ